MPNASRLLSRAWLAVSCLLLASLASASSLSIRSVDLPGQAQGSVLATEDGFLLSWIDRAGARAFLRFAELDAHGTLQRRGEIASGTQWFVNWADFPSLVIANNGDWLGYVLIKSDPAKPYAYDILTTRSTDKGNSWSPLTVLHDDGTQTEHGFVSLLADGADRVLAVWLDGRHTRSAAAHEGHDHGGAHTALHSAVLTRDGIIERQELDTLTCDCCRTVLTRGPQGPLALYRDRSREEIRDIYEVERTAEGWNTPRPLPTDGWRIHGCPVNGPAVTAVGESLLAAWPTQADGMPTLRLARREDQAWSALPELDRGESLLGRVDLAAWDCDSALVTWVGGDGAGHTLRLARVARNGAVMEQHVVAALPPGRSTGMPRIAARGQRALLVWTEPDGTASRLRGALITR